MGAIAILVDRSGVPCAQFAAKGPIGPRCEHCPPSSPSPFYQGAVVPLPRGEGGRDRIAMWKSAPRSSADQGTDPFMARLVQKATPALKYADIEYRC